MGYLNDKSGGHIDYNTFLYLKLNMSQVKFVTIKMPFKKQGLHFRTKSNPNGLPNPAGTYISVKHTKFT